MVRLKRRVFRTARACDGHHVIARQSSARRHRQGPKAARTRGRSEAQSLARCRAQMQHRRRDGRRVKMIPSVIAARWRKSTSKVARLKPPISRTATDRQARANATCLRATFSGRTGPNRPEDLGAIERVPCIRHAALLAAKHAVSDNLKRQRRPWRERPLRTGAGPLQARVPGSLTP
jgi:hypothetical protein